MVIILLVVAVIGGGVFLLTSGDDDDETSTTSTTEPTDDDDDDTTPSTEDNTPTDDPGTEPGSSSDADLEDAQAAVEEFIDAEQAEDCDAMISLLSEDFLDQLGGESTAVSTCEEGVQSVEVTGELEVVSDNGADGIEFEIEETVDGDEGYLAGYTVVQEDDGAWKIDSFE